MTATMLLQDSILKPSVFRSASEKQSFASSFLVNGKAKLLHVQMTPKKDKSKNA